MAFNFRKSEAAPIVQAFINRLPDRLEAALRAAAASGQTTLVFGYAPATDAEAQAFRTNTLVPQGWSVVVNTTDKTLTVS